MSKPKVPLHHRHPTGPPVHKTAFTGRGFMPDIMSEYAYTMFSVASTTLLEDGLVTGKDGMMPVAGNSLMAINDGSGGAGSFANRSSFQARG
jgi:hypothetical protein